MRQSNHQKPSPHQPETSCKTVCSRTLEAILATIDPSVCSNKPSEELKKSILTAVFKRGVNLPSVVKLLDVLYESAGLAGDSTTQTIARHALDLIEAELLLQDKGSQISNNPKALKQVQPTVPKTKAKQRKPKLVQQNQKPCKNQSEQPLRHQRQRFEKAAPVKEIDTMAVTAPFKCQEDGSKEACKPIKETNKQDKQVGYKREQADEDWLDDIIVYTEEDLKNMKVPQRDNTQYLTLQHLNPSYEYYYINSLDDMPLIHSVFGRLLSQKHIGIDTEWKRDHQKATYLQLSTEDMGVVFNIHNYKLRFDPTFFNYCSQLLSSPTIHKVGHSLTQDMKALKLAFMSKIELGGMLSLETHQFTCNQQILSVSTLARRFFGLHMDKDYQSWIADNVELEQDDEREYAILDALAPLKIFSLAKEACAHKVSKGTFILRESEEGKVDTSEFLLDHSLEALQDFFGKSEQKCSVLRDKTYAGKIV